MLKYRRIIGLVAAIMVLFGLVCTALASSATDDGSWTYFTLDRGAASTSSPSARTKYVNPVFFIFLHNLKILIVQQIGLQDKR